MTNFFRAVCLAAVAALIAACAGAPVAAPQAAEVTGTATYRERIALPPAAVFEAVLADVSLADAPAIELGRTRIEPAGQVPIRFSIAYDPAKLQPGHRYAVRAQIVVAGQLMFTSDTLAPVLGASGVRHADLLLRRVGNAAAPQAARASLTNTYWKAMSLRGAPVVVGEGQSEPHFILQLAQERVVGSGGCNRLTGSYAIDGDKLTFARGAATMMMCARGVEQERVLLDVLGATARWRIDGERLELFDASGAVIGLFESRYLQ